MQDLPFMNDEKIYNELISKVGPSAEEFWKERSEIINWMKPYTKVLEKTESGANKWFIDGEFNHCHTILDDNIKKGFGDNEALVIYDNKIRKSYTYKQLLSKVKKLATGFKKSGVDENSRILICGASYEKRLLSALSLLRLGALFGFVYYKFPGKVIEGISKNINLTHLIYEGSPRKEINLDHPSLDELQTIILLDDTKDNNIYKNPIIWNDLINNEEYTFERSFKADRPSFFVLTSGTTGNHKCALSGTVGIYLAGQSWLKCSFDVNPKSRILMPIDLAFGGSIGIFLISLSMGSKLIIKEEPIFLLQDEFNQEIINKEKIDSLMMSPNHLDFLIQKKIQLKPFNQSLKVGFVGQKISPEVWELVLKTFTNESTYLINFMGQTEVFSGTFISLPEKRPTTENCNLLNRLPWCNFKIEGGGDEGPLLIENNIPSMFKGYLNDNGSYKNSWTSDNKYLITGDIVKKINNKIEVLSRSEDSIKNKGVYLNINKLKKFVTSIESVKESEVIIYEDKGAKRFAIYVIPNGDNFKNLEEEIIDKIKNNVGSYAVPEKVIIINKFPLSVKGDIDKGSLISNLTE